VRNAGRCDKPIEVCLVMPGDHVVDRSNNIARDGQYISVEKALAVHKLATEAGLVAMSIGMKYDQETAPPGNFICYCCGCCCHALRTFTLKGIPHGFRWSNFQARVDLEKCKACRTCVEACPTNAWQYHPPHRTDGKDEGVVLIPERCIGCGVCALQCARKAIKLVRVGDFVPPTMMEMAERREFVMQSRAY